MKFLIVLCLGTLVFSAPAPQGRRNIDFLWRNNQDEETPASVRPVESSTVEPKVTATKITDPRTSVPVREEEEEADVQEEPREPNPTASPLNSEQAESDFEADIGDHSAQKEETNDDGDSEINQENEDQTEANEVTTTERAIIDTTIRVYDEEEENGRSDREEEEQTERVPQEEQAEEQEKRKPSDQEDVEREEEQPAAIDDSYQYDDGSLEHQLQEVRTEGQITTTNAPESSTEMTVSDVVTNAGFDTNEYLNRGILGTPNWHYGPNSFRGRPHGFHGPPHYRGQHGEGPPPEFNGPHPHEHRFEGPPPSWVHHGQHGEGAPPHNYFRPPFGDELNVPHSHQHRFEGPPPWVHGHHHHRFQHDDSNVHRQDFNDHGVHKAPPFSENIAPPSNVAWPSWKPTSSPEEVTPFEVNNLADL